MLCVNAKLEELKSHIEKNFLGKVNAVASIDRETLVIKTDANSLNLVVLFLRDYLECNFKQLIDICGVDYPEKASRFEVVYQFLSVSFNIRAMVKLSVKEGESVPSLAKIYGSACWYEREVFDMYGVEFSDCPDLRRILTDYNFEGHPLRKDFPLSGYTEVRYDNEKGAVVYEPVKLEQEYRDFDFMTPWEGSEYKSVVGEDS